MRIEKYPFKPKHRMTPAQMLEGVVTLPQDSKIVHVGAEPPKGEMMLYCEVSEVELPKVKMEFAILQVGSTVPDGYSYRGYIMAVPLLFIYEKDPKAIVLLNS